VSRKRSLSTGSVPATPRSYRAGCGRTFGIRSEALDLALTPLAFPECGACPHRVDPEGAAPFCTLRLADAPNPFASLAGLDVPD